MWRAVQKAQGFRQNISCIFEREFTQWSSNAMKVEIQIYQNSAIRFHTKSLPSFTIPSSFFKSLAINLTLENKKCSHSHTITPRTNPCLLCLTATRTRHCVQSNTQVCRNADNCLAWPSAHHRAAAPQDPEVSLERGWEAAWLTWGAECRQSSLPVTHWSSSASWDTGTTRELQFFWERRTSSSPWGLGSQPQ